MSAELHITAPANGQKLTQGAVFTISGAQQVQGGMVQGAAQAQYTTDPINGPWVTAQNTGPLTAPAGGSQWSAQDNVFNVTGVRVYLPVSVRVGVWPDQGLTGPPTYASDFVTWGVRSPRNAVAPDR